METGGFLANSEEVGNLVIKVADGRPVYLRDVARITDGPEEPSNYVFMGLGPASTRDRGGLFEAVTISIAKKKGTNATHIAERALEKIEALKGNLIPSGVEMTTTRNYGETAKEKSDELLKHMVLAALSVTLLIALALGWRESIVVAVAVPVTLALTILVTYLFGYTLNRVTLFALIFSIGILVDDAIVVVENIHRHFKMSRVDPEVAVQAVDEVGNPDHPGHLCRHRRPAAHGRRIGSHGTLHASHPGGGLGRHDHLPAYRLHHQPLAEHYRAQKGRKRQGVRRKKRGKVLAFFNRIYEKNLRGLLEKQKKGIFFVLVLILLLAAFAPRSAQINHRQDAPL